MNSAIGDVLVVGGGTMGRGITQVLLQAGADVWLSEVSAGALQGAMMGVEAGLEKADSSAAMANCHGVVGLPGTCHVDLVIEAVPEQVELKCEVLPAIESAVGSDTLIASNTSSLSIDELARALQDRGRFLGMHFFNPVPRSALVEIVVGRETHPKAVDRARAWTTSLGKEAITVRDSPGFATSRLGLAVGLEAIRMLEEGVASAEDIDRGMVLGYRFPIGPLALTDLVGLDVRLAIAEHLAGTLGERFTPPQLLRSKVAAGELGKKTGRGFFQW